MTNKLCFQRNYHYLMEIFVTVNKSCLDAVPPFIITIIFYPNLFYCSTYGRLRFSAFRSFNLFFEFFNFLISQRMYFTYFLITNGGWWANATMNLCPANPSTIFLGNSSTSFLVKVPFFHEVITWWTLEPRASTKSLCV